MISVSILRVVVQCVAYDVIQHLEVREYRWTVFVIEHVKVMYNANN